MNTSNKIANVVAFAGLGLIGYGGFEVATNFSARNDMICTTTEYNDAHDDAHDPETPITVVIPTGETATLVSTSGSTTSCESGGVERDAGRKGIFLMLGGSALISSSLIIRSSENEDL